MSVVLKLNYTNELNLYLIIFMRKNLTLALFLNLIFLFFVSYIFFTKGLSKEIVMWKIIALSLSVIVFSIFILLIVKQIKRTE